MSTQTQQPPFAIGDGVEFIEDPALLPERVINITWIDAEPPHWQVETTRRVGGREHRRIADADELRAGLALTSGRAAFVNVMHWALILCCETANGHVSEASRDRIVEGAWRAYNEMAGAELDMPSGWPGDDR